MPAPDAFGSTFSYLRVPAVPSVVSCAPVLCGVSPTYDSAFWGVPGRSILPSVGRSVGFSTYASQNIACSGRAAPGKRRV